MMTLFAIILSLVLVCLGYTVYKLLWLPFHIQHMLNSQGIKGPSYELFHGNAKQIIMMREKARNKQMELSHDVYPQLQPHLYYWRKLYGNDFLLWIGTQPELVVTEPKLVKEILNNRDGLYPKARVEGFVAKLVGDSVAVTEGEKWFKLRKLANHAFHGESLKDMIPTMVASIEAMLENWRSHEGKEIDVSEYFRGLTADVISRTAFGSNYLKGRNIFELLTQLIILLSRNEYRINIFGLGKFVRRKDYIEADKIERKLQDSIMEIVDKREIKVKTGQANNFGRDFLGSLLKSHHDVDPKTQVSALEIIDECKTFYLAGQETTHALLSWTMLLLSIHVDWQEKARDEVVEVFGRENPESEGLAKLKIVQMILYETLRLYSPATSLARRINISTTLGKYKIPSGININVPPYLVHHNPDIWGEDAHLFRPERFVDGLAKATNGNPVAFLGFGFGPRMCVGMNFAMNEAKIALSMILQRYKFTLSKNYVHLPHIALTVQPQHGVQIMLQPI